MLSVWELPFHVFFFLPGAVDVLMAWAGNGAKEGMLSELFTRSDPFLRRAQQLSAHDANPAVDEFQRVSDAPSSTALQQLLSPLDSSLISLDSIFSSQP